MKFFQKSVVSVTHNMRREGLWKAFEFFTGEAQTALFKDAVRTAP